MQAMIPGKVQILLTILKTGANDASVAFDDIAGKQSWRENPSVCQSYIAQLVKDGYLMQKSDDTYTLSFKGLDYLMSTDIKKADKKRSLLIGIAMCIMFTLGLTIGSLLPYNISG